MIDSGNFGFVVIGRNEGERLKGCLTSIPTDTTTVYVDSGSTDGSVEWARQRGVDIVELDTTQLGFTAARARNAGFRRLKTLVPKLTYVQFIDGDCELVREWPQQAVAFLESDTNVCAVFGRRRERNPSRSIYNRLCDIEWDVPVGQQKAFGGDVMIRAEALDAVGGYRDDLIAGEEPELGVRLRAKGWQIWRLDAEMTVHDAAITRFNQWWRRHVRSGYAFAEGAFIHGAPPERHWVWETRRALAWGIALPLIACITSIQFWPWGLLIWLIYPLQCLRLFLRSPHPFRQRVFMSVFNVLGRFPEAQGCLKFTLQRISKRPAQTIEYKT